MPHELIKLVGKTIKAVRLVEDALLIFETDEGPIGYEVHGDCCSSSYFYEISGVEKILGQKIVSVEDIHLDDPKSPSDYEEIQAYGFYISAETETVKIQGEDVETSRSMLLVFRNSSNGYYGGWIEETSEDLTDKVGGKVIESKWCLE